MCGNVRPKESLFALVTELLIFEILLENVLISRQIRYSRHDILELNPQIHDEIDSTILTIVPARDDSSRQVDCNDDEARMYDDEDLRPEAFDYKDPTKHLNSRVHDDSI
jgi:hypothetical protein